MPRAAENAQVALEERVPALNYQLGKGEWLVEGAHGYGGAAIATVTSEKHALAAERAGADALLVTGHEAAAHGGRVTSLVLVPAVARAVSIPVVAAGGFADGAGLLAALSLGAEGVAMGTRFAATRESGLHPGAVKAIIEKRADETLYTRNFDGMWARIMKTPTSERLTRRPLGFLQTAWRALRSARAMGLPLGPVLTTLVRELDRARLLAYFGAAIPLVERATLAGDVVRGVQFVGQAQGLVSDVPPAGDLVRRVVAEADEILARLQSQAEGVARTGAASHRADSLPA
jgi:enoyl-[acyl-carrier protein] reductase II